jgi:hypothetical protein
MAAAMAQTEFKTESIVLTPEKLREIFQAHFRAFVSEVGIINGKVIVVFPGKIPGSNSIRPE